jgi:hypothetical protein
VLNKKKGNVAAHSGVDHEISAPLNIFLSLFLGAELEGIKNQR